LLWDEKIEQKMAEEDDYDLESRPSRSVSAMAIEFEPDLEAPLLASVGAKPQSRLAPLLVLFAFIVIVILLASMMGSLSLRRHVSRNASPISVQLP